jgi:hypothetical protein
LREYENKILKKILGLIRGNCNYSDWNDVGEWLANDFEETALWISVMNVQMIDA